MNIKLFCAKKKYKIRVHAHETRVKKQLCSMRGITTKIWKCIHEQISYFNS